MFYSSLLTATAAFSESHQQQAQQQQCQQQSQQHQECQSNRSQQQLSKYQQTVFSGAVAGALKMASLYPLDSWKTRVQSGFKLSTIGQGSQQLQTLYKGFSLAFSNQIVGKTVFFGVYEMLKGWEVQQQQQQKINSNNSDTSHSDYPNSDQNHNLSTSTLLSCALVATCANLIVETPLEVAKQRLQVAVASGAEVERNGLIQNLKLSMPSKFNGGVSQSAAAVVAQSQQNTVRSSEFQSLPVISHSQKAMLNQTQLQLNQNSHGQNMKPFNTGLALQGASDCPNGRYSTKFRYMNQNLIFKNQIQMIPSESSDSCSNSKRTGRGAKLTLTNTRNLILPTSISQTSVANHNLTVTQLLKTPTSSTLQISSVRPSLSQPPPPAPIRIWPNFVIENASYRGTTPFLAREILFKTLQYPLFDVLKAWRLNYNSAKSNNYDSKKLTLFESGCCGSVAASICGFITMPIDVLKTRIMVSKPTSSAPSPAMSSELQPSIREPLPLTQTQSQVHSIHTKSQSLPLTQKHQLFQLVTTLHHIGKTEGVTALFAGTIPRMCYMSCAGFIFFGSFEKLQQWMVVKDDGVR